MRTAEEFWARVDRSGDGCHNWLGGRNNTGYGTVAWHGRTVTARRLGAFLLGVVDSPSRPDWLASTFVLHTCDNKLCCNPTHWRLGTMSENQKEAYERSLRRAYKGSAHANSRLTPDQIIEIRRRWPAETQAHLGKVFGVTQTCISSIVRGKTYATQ